MNYQNTRYPVRERIRTTHSTAWDRISRAGTWWSGADRIAMVKEARAALNCDLCRRRKAALSPFSDALASAHTPISPDNPTSPEGRAAELPESVIDMIHRISTDPGRLTRAWFDSVMASGISMPEYIEVLSVVTTSIMIDTLHRTLGLEPPSLPDAVAGEPSRKENDAVIDGGAWVPLMPADLGATETGMPSVPNIVRAMSLVPDAVKLYFDVERAHYTVAPIAMAISRDQMEFVAARVSALNQCFY